MIMAYARETGRHIEEVFRYFPALVLQGARQVGKTTLLQELFPEVKRFTFDPSVDIAGARQDPDLFLQNNPSPLFLDEIQYAPELLSALKREIDRDRRPGRYLLSGSHNLSLLKQVSESLAGRIAVLELRSMSCRELWQRTTEPSFLQHWLATRTLPAFPIPSPPETLAKRVWRGGFPGLIELPDSMVSIWWDSYLSTYLERDVRLVSNVHSLPIYRRFLRLMAAMTAQELNANELGRELEIHRGTALAWKSILEATWQWFEVPPWSRNAIKRVAGKPKGYLSDTGMACHLLQIPSPEALVDHPLWGALFETFAAQEIAKAAQKMSTRPAYWHFRSTGGAEVDLVLEYQGRLYPIEFKAKSNPSGRDARGILSFKECFPKEDVAPGLVVCAVSEPRRIAEHAWAIPWWWIG